MAANISSVDLWIIGAYFLVVLAIGIGVGLKTRTDDDLFLGGRSLTWAFIGFSLFASNISSTTLIGLSGSAYSTGIAVSNYEWMAGVPLILMAAVFVPLYLKARITTVPEFLELRFDRRSRTVFSLITIFISIVVDTAGGLYAGAIVLKVFFPELVLWQTTLALAVFAGFYTAVGGLKAVVYTDTLQAVILIVGCSILTYLLFREMGFSWAVLQASVPPGHLSVIKPLDDPTLPWLGTLIGVPVLGFWYWVTNQYIVQRVLAAKNVSHARWGVMLGGFMKIIPLFIMVLPGAMAISVLPGIAARDMVFPTLVIELLPVGAVGIVLAGLISAIMSSVDSTLNSASTLIVVDFLKPRLGNATPKQIAGYGRIATFALMAVAAVWAPMIGNFGGLWNYLQQVFAIVVPPIAAIFLFGVFYPKGNGTGALVTLLLGTALGMVVFILARLEIWTIHFSINVGLMFAVSCVIFVIASRWGGRATAEQLQGLVYHPALLQPATPEAYRDYRYLAAGLLVAMFGVLVIFW
ncbi:sodium/solute symporter [Exilibacterium tricleocarpae]|uniref:Sodium/solute symporter n=1 Tax=Exilibacterium tricleocarpae TaxID=2591008 RepID=A0A545TAL4_9GAMM|nr:sodium:solute symporter [Exilibacterium tricleocarpae]TQV74260.1 sodium/solute symporter [Exilibacterium tricleocarpae]